MNKDGEWGQDRTLKMGSKQKNKPQYTEFQIKKTQPH